MTEPIQDKEEYVVPEITTVKELEQVIRDALKASGKEPENMKSGSQSYLTGYTENSCAFDLYDGLTKITVKQFLPDDPEKIQDNQKYIHFEVRFDRETYDTHQIEAIGDILNLVCCKVDVSDNLHFSTNPRKDDIKQALQTYITAEEEVFKVHDEYVDKLKGLAPKMAEFFKIT